MTGRASKAVALGVGALVAFCGSASAKSPEPTAVAAAKTPTATGSGGGAATVDRLATRAAIKTLRRGGNAVDASVAAAAVLGVVEPFSCGIGGGGFMVIRRGSDGRVTTIDHRETAPRRMTPRSFMENGKPLAFPDARYSGLSVGVPGTVAGWDLALRRYGTWSLERALAPGTEVSREGFKVDQTFFDQVQANATYFDDVPSTRRLYLDPDGTPRDVGTKLRNRQLARTYRMIAKDGPSAFYRGAISDAIVSAVKQPPVAAGSEHQWRPGVMARRDLRRYRALERKAVRVGYRDYDVYGMGPPSSGATTIGEALKILQAYDLRELGRTETLHRTLEASRLAFADRNAYVADPAFFDVPLRGLLSDSFARERRALLGASAANAVVAPGNPYDDQGDSAPAAGARAVVERYGSTTHLVVSDEGGTVVSYTFTIESTGGNGVVVPKYGFLLNNELTDFNFDSTTHPNRVQGGKRPRSSMSPTIVVKDGNPVLAVGSPGGSTIITTVLQVLVDRLDLRIPLPQAIGAPRASQRNTMTTAAEPDFLGSPEGQALAAPPYNHAFSLASPPEIGAVTAIELRRRVRVLAAAEPTRRGGGSAMVVR
ncbi:MAG: gamma-glutamyltransferase [Actinomycetota bacterium]|nr:gamma-glutamyltransferase [Actinomycetota bacterium]